MSYLKSSGVTAAYCGLTVTNTLLIQEHTLFDKITKTFPKESWIHWIHCQFKMSRCFNAGIFLLSARSLWSKIFTWRTSWDF